jgi:hypothetical protein
MNLTNKFRVSAAVRNLDARSILFAVATKRCDRQYDGADLMHPESDFANLARVAASIGTVYGTVVPKLWSAKRFQRKARARTALINWLGWTAPIEAL